MINCYVVIEFFLPSFSFSVEKCIQCTSEYLMWFICCYLWRPQTDKLCQNGFFFKVGPTLLVGIPLWALHQPNSWIKPFQASSVSVFAWLCFLLKWWMTNCATGQPAPYVIMSKKTGSWFSFREFQRKFLSFNNKSSSCQVLLGVWYGGR